VAAASRSNAIGQPHQGCRRPPRTVMTGVDSNLYRRVMSPAGARPVAAVLSAGFEPAPSGLEDRRPLQLGLESRETTSVWRSRQESNLHFILRRDVTYPLVRREHEWCPRQDSNLEHSLRRRR
jgi:hypothetical protein